MQVCISVPKTLLIVNAARIPPRPDKGPTLCDGPFVLAGGGEEVKGQGSKEELTYPVVIITWVEALPYPVVIITWVEALT